MSNLPVKMDYDKNFSDHVPQTANVSFDNNASAKFLTWNIAKKCTYSNTNGNVFTNNGFDKKNESDGEYLKRVSAIGNQINKELKSDNRPGIVFLQETPDKDSLLTNNMLANTKYVAIPQIYSFTNEKGKNEKNNVMTVFDSEKYENKTSTVSQDIKNILDDGKDKNTKQNSMHNIQATLLCEKKDPKTAILAVNIHANSSHQQDPKLLEKIEGLKKLAIANNAKLVIGGDFNRDLKDQKGNFMQGNESLKDLQVDHAGAGMYGYDKKNDKQASAKARDGFIVGNGANLGKDSVAFNTNLNQKPPALKNTNTNHQQAQVTPMPKPTPQPTPKNANARDNKAQVSPVKSSHRRFQPEVIRKSITKEYLQEALLNGMIPCVKKGISIFDNLLNDPFRMNLEVGMSQTLINFAAKSVLDYIKVPNSSVVKNINPNHDEHAIKIQFSSQQEAQKFSDKLKKEFGITSLTHKGQAKTAQDGAIYMTKEDINKLTKATGLTFSDKTGANAYISCVNNFKSNTPSIHKQQVINSAPQEPATKIQFKSQLDAARFSFILKDRFGITSSTNKGQLKTPQNGAIFLTKSDIGTLEKAGIKFSNNTGTKVYKDYDEFFKSSSPKWNKFKDNQECKPAGYISQNNNNGVTNPVVKDTNQPILSNLTKELHRFMYGADLLNSNDPAPQISHDQAKSSDGTKHIIRISLASDEQVDQLCNLINQNIMNGYHGLSTDKNTLSIYTNDISAFNKAINNFNNHCDYKLPEDLNKSAKSNTSSLTDDSSDIPLENNSQNNFTLNKGLSM